MQQWYILSFHSREGNVFWSLVQQTIGQPKYKQCIMSLAWHTLGYWNHQNPNLQQSWHQQINQGHEWGQECVSSPSPSSQANTKQSVLLFVCDRVWDCWERCTLMTCHHNFQASALLEVIHNLNHWLIISWSLASSPLRSWWRNSLAIRLVCASVILILIPIPIKVCLIRKGWDILNCFPLSMSMKFMPRYDSKDLSSVNSNFLGPFLRYWTTLMITCTKTMTFFWITTHGSTCEILNPWSIDLFLSISYQFTDACFKPYRDYPTRENTVCTDFWKRFHSIPYQLESP